MLKNFFCYSAGEAKPDWQLILSALDAELRLLSGVGFEHRGVTFKVRIGYLMADTVAKNDLMGMKGVGARNGCSHCRIEVSNSNKKIGMSIKNNDYNLPFSVPGHL